MFHFITSRLTPLQIALLHGQWISILIAGTGVFATILSNTTPSSNFPLLMSFMNYLFLSTFLIRKNCLYRNHSLVNNDDSSQEFESPIKSSEDPRSSISLLWYIGAAILDVEANFLVILAYNYTTITSVMLLDCFTIPCAMLLSYFFLNCRYTYKHIIGIIICISGLVCIIINDSLNSDGNEANNQVLGDVFCLLGSILYAMSNVLQEHLVKFHDRDTFLGYLGSFGMLIAFIQFMALELSIVESAIFTMEVIFSIFGFVVCLFFMYVNTSSFLQESDAIVFNLSLLTSDVYAVIFSYFFYGYLVSWLYFLSFFLIMIGLYVYHREKKPIVIGNEDSVRRFELNNDEWLIDDINTRPIDTNSLYIVEGSNNNYNNQNNNNSNNNNNNNNNNNKRNLGYNPLHV